VKWLLVIVLALPTILLSLLSPTLEVEQSVQLDEVVPIAQNATLTVPSSFNVIENKDFYLAIWIRSDEPLRDAVMSKVDFEIKGKPGLSLRFIRLGEETRPQVYWKNTDKGGWFTFAPIKQQPNKWKLFLLSFRENQYLGLHVAYETEAETAELVSLGGYKLSFFPSSESLMKIGKVTTPGYRGEIGPILVFQGGSKKSFEILKELIAEPEQIPTKETIFSGTEGLEIEKKRND